MANPIAVTINEEKLRFESTLNNGNGYIDYRWYKGSLALVHIFVPVESRGKGVPEALAEFALQYAKQRKLKIMVYCSYIAKYIKQHPEYEYLKDERYHQK